MMTSKRNTWPFRIRKEPQEEKAKETTADSSGCSRACRAVLYQ